MCNECCIFCMLVSSSSTLQLPVTFTFKTMSLCQIQQLGCHLVEHLFCSSKNTSTFQLLSNKSFFDDSFLCITCFSYPLSIPLINVVWSTITISFFSNKLKSGQEIQNSVTQPVFREKFYCSLDGAYNFLKQHQWCSGQIGWDISVL